MITLPACPPPKEGVHSWVLGAANRCRNAGLPAAAAEQLIAQHITRPPSPPNEIETSVAKAYDGAKMPGRLCAPRLGVPPRPDARSLAEVTFDPAKLEALARLVERPRSWRHFLWERSPKRPEAMSAFAFLLHLYRHGERVLVFDDMKSLRPAATLEMRHPMDCRVPAQIKEGGHGAGVWYLCNPVDGQWHPNPRQGNRPSCRSEESLTACRYAVLESDKAEPDLWLAFLVQLPARIAAIYTSGGRSIHALIQVDAPDKAAWDAVVEPLKRPLKALGADPACLSAVRLTRLPGCRRPETGGFQKLLYLAPNPPAARLVDLPPLWNRDESLRRWREICPRWNPHMQPYQ